MKFFWILWIFNTLMSLVPIYFFFEGLADGTVNSTNFLIWVVLLGVIALLLSGTYWLKMKNQLQAARIILILAAIPGLLVILLFAVALITDVRWN
jgi:hypothetical protein